MSCYEIEKEATCLVECKQGMIDLCTSGAWCMTCNESTLSSFRAKGGKLSLHSALWGNPPKIEKVVSFKKVVMSLTMAS